MKDRKEQLSKQMQLYAVTAAHGWEKKPFWNK